MFWRARFELRATRFWLFAAETTSLGTSLMASSSLDANRLNELFKQISRHLGCSKEQEEAAQATFRDFAKSPHAVRQHTEVDQCRDINFAASPNVCRNVVVIAGISAYLARLRELCKTQTGWPQCL